MALKFIQAEERNSDDLPWLSDYLGMYPDKADKYVSPIQNLILGEKGILIITLDYKGFLFKDSKICKFLLQAIEYWKKDPKNAQINGLFFSASKKPNIAVDDEITDVVVIFETSTRLQLQWGNQTKKSATDNGDTNPFIKKPKK